jgi:hypothetical protein
VKVVSVGDPSNERAVMKNAHEIAILRSSSHPNIIQAYSCLTDVCIRDVIALCTRCAQGFEGLGGWGGWVTGRRPLSMVLDSEHADCAAGSSFVCVIVFTQAPVLCL